ncbi:uncharacterized protein LOC132556147 [Ylistrum balloti]|uniref:uncharacterized protein LOC132556147 n=1 Tax=Ylistrum balloti TaxID=509963 RepID=UPI002905F044|nr:uncharacterized protein LOC132556147 [Ylistrum balloti]
MASGRSAQKPVSYMCSLCKKRDNVKWFCNDCQQDLCDQCKEFHTRGTKTKSDDVVSIGKANRQNAKPLPEVCKLHPGKLCDGYCCDCDMLVCLMCLSQTHKHHNWKNLEDEVILKQQQIKEHITKISAKITLFKNETLLLYRAKKVAVDNIDGTRTEVNSQRIKLKYEVDQIANAVLAEVSSLEKEQLAQYDKVCQPFEKKIGELTRLLEKAEMANTSCVSMFETERLLRSTLPMYDVNVENVSRQLPNFVAGSIARHLLKEMFGVLIRSNQYEKIDIDSNHIQRLSKFTVNQQTDIYDICPVDDRHAWLSIYKHKGLVLVNRDSLIAAEVTLDFCPRGIAMVGTTDVLITQDPCRTSIYKVSLQNKKLTTFANISPHHARDISINKTGEVFVTTGTPDIVVLNQSGTTARKFSCGLDKSLYISCLSSGHLGVMGDGHAGRHIILIDESGTAIHRWTGELDNGQKARDMFLCNITCDKYNRLFIPDLYNNQVYVLSSGKKQARCILDQKYGIDNPLVVSVNTCGNVWIGCRDGTVHVMRL